MDITKSENKWIFLFIFVIIIFLTILVIYPYYQAIIAAMILAYLLHPIYIIVSRNNKRPVFGASMTLIFLMVAVLIPMFFLAGTLYKEAGSMMLILNNKDILSIDCTENSQVLCVGYNKVKEKVSFIDFDKEINSIIKNALDWLREKAFSYITSIPEYILHIFVALFILFYLLMDWKHLYSSLSSLLPLTSRNKKILIDSLRTTVHGVVFGQIMTAIIQGIIGMIGFFIIGIPNPFLWGLLVAIVALVPYVGTALVWLPLSAFMLFNGIMMKDYFRFGQGVLLLFYGALVISTIDNFVRPKLIGDKANLHPGIVLIGVLGGFKVFGLIGILLGPIVLAIGIVFIKFYSNDIIKDEDI